MREFLGRALARGTYLIGRYNVFVAAPPLVVTEAQIEDGVRAIDAALGEVGG
jgi:taurine--2-oxoglutarate transaminase